MDENAVANIPIQCVDGQNVSESHMTLFGKDIGMTRDQLIALVTLSFGFFFCWAYFSMFAPFFPGIATKKNLNSTEIGITFGIIPFVLLVFSPIFGKYVIIYMYFMASDYFIFIQIFFKINTIGIKFLVVSGFFLGAGSMILFG